VGFLGKKKKRGSLPLEGGKGEKKKEKATARRLSMGGKTGKTPQRERDRKKASPLSTLITKKKKREKSFFYPAWELKEYKDGQLWRRLFFLLVRKKKDAALPAPRRPVETGGRWPKEDRRW